MAFISWLFFIHCTWLLDIYFAFRIIAKSYFNYLIHLNIWLFKILFTFEQILIILGFLKAFILFKKSCHFLRKFINKSVLNRLICLRIYFLKNDPHNNVSILETIFFNENLLKFCQLKIVYIWLLTN